MAKGMHDIAAPDTSSWPVNSALIPDSLLSHHDRQRRGYYVRRLKGSMTWLMFFTVRGYGWFRSKEEDVETASTMDIHLYRPGEYQEYGAIEHGIWNFHWVHFIPRPTWTTLLALPPIKNIPGLMRTNIASPDSSRRILGHFTDLHRDSMMSSPYRRELAYNSLERILLLAAENVGGNSARQSDPRILSILEEIAMHPDAPYSLVSLAKQVHLSPHRLAHLFKSKTGLSVIDTVIKTRLMEAAKLLRTGENSIQAIAALAGFNSPFYFSRRFKAMFGTSPSDFRIMTAVDRIKVGSR